MSHVSNKEVTDGVIPQTFAFIGDTEVGARLGAHLLQAGYTASNDFAQAEVVFTYAGSPSLLEDVYYGTPGLIQDAADGALLVDLSPTVPSFARELNAVAAVNNRYFIDAPFTLRDTSVEDAFIDARNIIILAGGSEKIYKRVHPLLSCMAKTCRYMGGVGAGQTAKVALTLQNAASLMGMVEAFASHSFTEDAYDLDELFDIASTAGFIAPAMAGVFDALCNKAYRGTYTMEMLMGELNAALMFSEEQETAFPQADSAFHLLQLLGVVGAAQLAPTGAVLAFATQDEATSFGLDWSRAEGMYHDHDEDDEDDNDFIFDDEDFESDFDENAR